MKSQRFIENELVKMIEVSSDFDTREEIEKELKIV